ncbi:MAG: CDP-diacylglycerol--glycerol-3-phosphate 3-phosphatidyltransferase [Zavarzinella sp.]
MASIWNFPNILTISRIPLSGVLFATIHYGYWQISLLLFALASFTDWLDGWWARKFNQLTVFGRTFDPLIDKIMVGGVFIFLIPVSAAKMAPWMVATIIGREILVTGIRGYVETLGKKFGADWFGKLKMLLQCILILLFLVLMAGKDFALFARLASSVFVVYEILLYITIAVTVLSGVQYCWKASKLVQGVEPFAK